MLNDTFFGQYPLNLYPVRSYLSSSKYYLKIFFTPNNTYPVSLGDFSKLLPGQNSDPKAHTYLILFSPNGHESSVFHFSVHMRYSIYINTASNRIQNNMMKQNLSNTKSQKEIQILTWHKNVANSSYSSNLISSHKKGFLSSTLLGFVEHSHASLKDRHTF